MIDSIDKNFVFYRVVKIKLDIFFYFVDIWNGEVLFFIRFCISWFDGCLLYVVRIIVFIIFLLWSVIMLEVFLEWW